MFYAPGQDVQQPTLSRLHVRDALDAQTIFEAVRRGIMKPVTRRLNEVERASFIQSGAIFVWEESDDELGLKRWTDGRLWSQSRMREPYLFYDEKLPNDPSGGNNGQAPRSQAVFRFVDGSSRGNGASSILSHFDRSAHRPPGLVKQAYSAWVTVSPTSRPRKWHLTAYFTYSDLQNLPTIDCDPMLRQIKVPPGIYRSGKARSRNSELNVDTCPSSLASSDTSSPPQTPGTLGGSEYGSPMSVTAHLQSRSDGTVSARALPPLHTAVPNDGIGGRPRVSSPQREPRWSEDQRMIQMLNSKHVR